MSIRKKEGPTLWTDQVDLNSIQHDFNKALERKAYNVLHEVRICRDLLIQRYYLNHGEYPVQDNDTHYWH